MKASARLEFRSVRSALHPDCAWSPHMVLRCETAMAFVWRPPPACHAGFVFGLADGDAAAFVALCAHRSAPEGAARPERPAPDAVRRLVSLYDDVKGKPAAAPAPGKAPFADMPPPPPDLMGKGGLWGFDWDDPDDPFGPFDEVWSEDLVAALFAR